MTDNNFILAYITKVRLYIRLYKISQHNYGNISETFDIENKISNNQLFCSKFRFF
jgi:hypothetical protein